MHPRERVGCQAAFAGMPAPTGVLVHPRVRVGCQAAFAGRPAPTGVLVHGTSARTGRLSGRLRWQASSHRGFGTSASTGRLVGRHRWQASSHRILVHPRERVGCQAAFAGRPAPTGSRTPTKIRSAVRPPSLANSAPTRADRRTPTKPRGRALARLALLICPPLREAERRFCAVGNPAWMPG